MRVNRMMRVARDVMKGKLKFALTSGKNRMHLYTNLILKFTQA